MGACNSAPSSDDSRQFYYENGQVIHHTTTTTGSPSARSLRRTNGITSLIRIGSRTFKPVEVEDPMDGTTRTQLSARRASTYDHVHNLVKTQMADNGTVSGGTGTGAGGYYGRVGLRNLGNTCFLNSSLQCLSNTIPLTDYFLGYDYRTEINYTNFLGTKGELAKAYAALMKDMWLGKHPILEPLSFKRRLEQFAPQFEGSDQHDAQELLSFLLDGIHEDLNRVKRRPYIEEKDCDGTQDEVDSMNAWQNYLLRNKSIVVDLFQGQLRNTLTCLVCHFKNVKFDPFMYLSLPISDRCATLDDCLGLYCAEEYLTGDNRWYCPKCKNHVDATKKFDLWMLPPILIVHLKRFRFTEYGSRSKINQFIRYPMQNWNLSQMMKSSGGAYPLYDLYAIANHYGDLGSGHYMAHAMNRFDDEWYEFNDSKCTKIDEDDIGKDGSSAYVLFYNRAERSSGDGDDDDDDAGGKDTADKHGGGIFKKRKKSRRSSPIIRRQSVSRPELWPHMQIQDNNFRDFHRSTLRPQEHPGRTTWTSARSIGESGPEVIMEEGMEEEGEIHNTNSM